MPRVATTELNAAVAAALVPGTTYYLSLHSADPGTTGASELSGGGYARQAIVFGSASGGIIASNAAISVPNAGAVAVLYFGIYTASTSGTYKAGGPLAASTTGTPITFVTGAITFAAA